MRALWWLLVLATCSRAPEPISVACADPVAGCSLPDGLSVRFSGPPAMLETFELEMTAPADAEIHAGFQMRGMEMGMNRYRLINKDGKWRASVMLPACVQGRSDWILRLETGRKVYEVPFSAI